MSRAGRKMRKAEINKAISSESRRLAEINDNLNQLKYHGNRKTGKRNSGNLPNPPVTEAWRSITSRASTPITSSNLRGGCPWKIARFLRRKST